CDTALHTWHKLVLQADIREGPAHHHAVVAPARAIGVEVLLRHTVLDQIASRGTLLRNAAGGRNVVGSDGVAEHREYTSPANLGNGLRLRAEVSEKRRLLNVGGIRPPLVERAA